METIKEIFNHKLFRIPDYQRGYSWEKNHLDDFWQDISNLQKDRIHYTGMISVEEVDKSEYFSWEEDKWLIEGKGDKPYFIVDGQQRITTIIILIWVISDKITDLEQISYNSKKDIINKYIYTENLPEHKKSYIFGYHKDNPSYEFLKREIFEQIDGVTNSELEQTVYTNNLLYAKKYFIEKVAKLNIKDLGDLFDKITKQLKFDFKVLEKELDIFIVFETMNNRGKPLSNLEKLKNRLIYLSTLLKDDNPDLRIQLRNNINEHWKTIYKYLGLNKEKKLDDDLFLQSHWIMFKRYERREPEFYATDIFERYYTSQNVISGEENYYTISNYIESLALSVKQWFVMNNPSHRHAQDLAASDNVIFWLKKLNRLGFKSFAPLIMGALVIEEDKQKIVQLLKATESYVFLIFDVSFRRSNTGTYHFSAKASELYNKEKDIIELIHDIKYWIYGDDDYNGYFDINSFYSYLKDLFVREGSNGFYDWKYLRYFLFEYELYLNDNISSGRDWNELKFVEYIYPNNPVKACWKSTFKRFSANERKRLSGSLGNFTLLPHAVLEEDNCFEDKKLYFLNSKNSLEIANLESWGPDDILSRGVKMLGFMEKRWNISIPEDFKQELLFLDFDFEKS
ncbi:GmrSD restriction endonuclease domain-containing protein [Mucilaginibacter xinganensis]|uniref:Uncharacterized protein n=1 Tax=Mucilaginibacter xinganensis TaxID=1234841 RepID=A0A223NQZ4_9SPHI|nr:DUF262 domain-containing protein [Mucilaginibacter xinganensis]ASU32114.1 hypothetical protein MuYL_0211 [Mucilaginibacter xinganensis]